MSRPLEDYAMLSDLHTAALVSRDGSIDWLCLPRFDSPAVFAALLGETENGHWTVSVVGGEVETRRYVEGTCVLETVWHTDGGTVMVTDYMPIHADRQDAFHDLVRIVRCVEGSATVRNELRLRFDYGGAQPLCRSSVVEGADEVRAVAGPYAVTVRGPELPAHDGHHGADFVLSAGEELAWTLTGTPSYDLPRSRQDEGDALERTVRFWTEWADRIDTHGQYAQHIRRSLITLHALTDATTGGIVAAPTTSLPEDFGGVRNWDYRYVWLRDSALTIEALLSHGFVKGADAWRAWLLRAIAGDPHKLRIMYGLGGERRLPELSLDHLSGYEDSRPVRIGNGAAEQYQADVVGEVMVALEKARAAGLAEDEFSWQLQRAMLEFQEANLDTPDHGIWEMRGEPHYFTHGRAMMWAGFDRGVRAVEQHGLDGPVDRWRELRDRLWQEVWDHGYDDTIDSFVQTYGSTEVDASLLQLPQIGFIDSAHPRMLSTVARIEQDLVDDQGFVHRYRTGSGKDGLAGDEYPFLICSFWLMEQYARSGRIEDARTGMETLLAVQTDLGLLSEEYAVEHGRLAGNFPQAFSHLGLIRAADAIHEFSDRVGIAGEEHS